MLPLCDVVPATVAVVLQYDGVCKICVLQFRIKDFDFFAKRHHADLTNAPDRVDVLASVPATLIVPEDDAHAQSSK